MIIIASIEIEKGMTVLNELKKMQLIAAQCHEEPDLEEYPVDDISGASLAPKVANKARQDEIGYIRTMKLYTKAPVKECIAQIGKQPIATRLACKILLVTP